MRRIILWFAIGITIITVGINAAKISGQEPSRKYFPAQLSTSKINDETNRHYWRRVTVEINQPLSERRIRAMAKAIKEDDTRDFDRTWINFQFPHPISVGGAWAVVAFEGDRLDSSLMHGPTRQQMLDGFRFEDQLDKDIKQVWMTFEPPGERIALYHEDGNYYFERRILSQLDSTTNQALSIPGLPLSNWKRIRSESDKDFDEYGSDYYWRVDSENMLRRMNGDRLAFVAYPIIPVESRFPVVRVERVSEDDLCKQDLQCWGDKHALSASHRCQRAVENVLDGSVIYEWTDGWLDPKFTHYRWKPGMKEQGIVVYIGNKMKVQNVYGGWIPLQYECDFDPNTKKVIDIRVE